MIFLNKLAWSIDAEFLYVGGGSRDDAPDSLCFRYDTTNRTDAVTKRFHFDGGESDADLLLPLDGHNEFMSRRTGDWANRRAPRFAGAPFRRFVLLRHRHKVHRADGALSGSFLSYRRMHCARPVIDVAISAACAIAFRARGRDRKQG